MILRYFSVFMWSGWSRAPQKHQYSYRIINVFSMGPPGTLQVAQKLTFSRILLKSPKFSIISLKQRNFTKFNGILLISWFWWSHGSGPSIWPRKNKRFVKGRGFVEISDFLIFNRNTQNLMIFHKTHWNSWIHKNFSDWQGNSTFAPTCENNSNSKVF